MQELWPIKSHLEEVTPTWFFATLGIVHVNLLVWEAWHEPPTGGGTPPQAYESSADEPGQVGAAAATTAGIVLFHFLFTDGRLALWSMIKRNDSEYLSRYSDELNDHATAYAVELKELEQPPDPEDDTLPPHHHKHHRKKLAQQRQLHQHYEDTVAKKQRDHHRKHVWVTEAASRTLPGASRVVGNAYGFVADTAYAPVNFVHKRVLQPVANGVGRAFAAATPHPVAKASMTAYHKVSSQDKQRHQFANRRKIPNEAREKLHDRKGYGGSLFAGGRHPKAVAYAVHRSAVAAIHDGEVGTLVARTEIDTKQTGGGGVAKYEISIDDSEEGSVAKGGDSSSKALIEATGLGNVLPGGVGDLESSPMRNARLPPIGQHAAFENTKERLTGD
eukprot:SAG31_NODE_2577_length_5451_cov_3.176757_5_plen_389_part_00